MALFVWRIQNKLPEKKLVHNIHYIQHVENTFVLVGDDFMVF